MGALLRNDSYIYFLYDKNSIVRYIGHGRNWRYKDRANRSGDYRGILEDGGESVVIIEGLSKLEAIEIENKYLEMFKGVIGNGFNLINKIGSRRVSEYLSYKDCAEEFSLDEDSFPYLRYKNTTLSGKYRSVVSTKAGELVFKKEPRPYTTVQLKGHPVLTHRVIWVLSNKMDLDCSLVVDHIDSDPSNNHPSNLQAITQQQNIRKAKKNSSTGFVGVCLENGISPRYIAVWTVDHKQYCKSFGLRKYGKEEAFRLACEYREAMQDKFHNTINKDTYHV